MDTTGKPRPADGPELSAGELVAALADEARLRMFARIVLAGPDGVGPAELLPSEPGGEKAAGRCVQRLLRSGVVRRASDGRLVAETGAFRDAAAAARAADVAAERARGASVEVARLFSRGRLMDLPLVEPLRDRVLEHVADRFFTTGETYTESAVNEALTTVWGDFSTLRRDLVEAGFLARSMDGADYWRTTRRVP